MYVKLPLKDLNLNSYPPHSTNIYIYKVIIVLKVCGSQRQKEEGKRAGAPELSNVLTHNDLKYHICPATQKTQKKKKNPN